MLTMHLILHFTPLSHKSHILITSVACHILLLTKMFFTRKLKTDITHEFDSGCKLNADFKCSRALLSSSKYLASLKVLLRRKIKMNGNKWIQNLGKCADIMQREHGELCGKRALTMKLLFTYVSEEQGYEIVRITSYIN